MIRQTSGRTVLPPISPLSLNQLTRETWGQFDASAIAQLAPLAADPCFQQKFYKAPGDQEEVFVANGYAAFGMHVTPGSIIYGFYLPITADPAAGPESVWRPPQFTVQITDVSLDHQVFSDPVSSLFLSNYKPEFQSGVSLNQGSFPNLLTAPYPVTGTGLFMVEIQENAGEAQRIQLVFGVLEVCG